ncbi:tetratricopeptide repeat protein [Dyella sp. 2RAB6]|uniref:tetratricopeptide repeat protein n=1 Tax=Dyella sp. 2RAB6 TaxID=3232992 RepID=UPI003F9072D5
MRRFLYPALYILLVVLTVVVYADGLRGTFLFDDFANLPALGATGPVHDADSFLRFVTSGSADPIGRPVALASFLLDARDWPASPLPFKRTNLVLHVLNGLLLALLLRRLGWAMRNGDTRLHPRYELAALLGAALWLLHPLFVSTTLYIVQREAMLPATFTLAGLLFWLQAREAFRQGNTSAGWLGALLGLGLCTVFATLSKANGALLPALALSIEWFFLKPIASPDIEWSAQGRRQYRIATLCLMALPSAVVGLYLLHAGWQGIAHGISGVRPWTLEQRLITEPRVLFEYLRLLWLPHPYTAGIFNDQFVASTSLRRPGTTLPALLGVLGLLAAACLMRRKAPAVALAIAFYFVGQSMESSTVALELYFEHRNYLPALLMFWPLALWLCGAPIATASRVAIDGERATLFGQRAKTIIALAILTGFAWMTYARADLWGNTRDQALLWAMLNPQSPRAQAYAAQEEMAGGHPDQAIKRLAPALERNPDQVQLALNLLAARCQLGSIDPASMQASIVALRTTRDTGNLLASWFGRGLDQNRTPACPQMNLEGIEALLEAAMSNPRLMETPGRRQDLYHLRGRIALERHQPAAALASFKLALDQQVTPNIALQQAALLGSSGYPVQALQHLDDYESVRSQEFVPAFGMARVHAWILRRQHYWDKELVRLRQTLRSDAQSRPSSIESA